MLQLGMLFDVVVKRMGGVSVVRLERRGALIRLGRRESLHLE